MKKYKNYSKKYSKQDRQEALLKFLEDKSNANRNNFIQTHYGLITLISKHYVYDPSLEEDVFNEGVFGLMDAAERFNPTAGEFSTYAMFKIRNKVSDFLARSMKNEKCAPISMVWGPGRNKYNIPPVRSLQEKISVKDGDIEFGSTLASTTDSQLDIVENKSMKSKIKNALKEIASNENDPRILIIFQKRHFEDEELQYEEIAKLIGVTRQGVMFLYNKTMAKLKFAMRHTA